MRTVFRGLACVALLANTAVAQSPPSPPAVARNFDVGSTVLGVTVGVGGIGSASLAIGGRWEHAVGTMGSGILGIGVDADYYEYSSDVQGASSSVTYIPVGVSANYHFKPDNAKWDPFLGLGLGYSSVSASGGGVTVSATSGVYVIARGGVRYFWSSGSALQIDAGAGAATLNVGVVLKL